MKKQINSLLLNIFILLYLEILFSIIIFNSINIKSIIFYTISSITIASLIKIITSIFPNIVNKVLNILITGYIIVIFIAQLVHYKFYHVFFSIYSLKHGGQVFGFLEAIITVIIRNIGFIILLLVPLILLLVLIRKTNTNKNIKVIPIYIFIILISIIIQTNLINNDKQGLYSTYNLYNNNHSPTISVKNIGLINTTILDYKRYYKPLNDEVLKEENNNTYTNKTHNIKELNLKQTNNKNINKINNYIKTKEPSNKNKYTNLFKNKNLIFITAESFHPIAIDKNITPTLYKLSNQGFKFNNYYTPIYYASTIDGEYSLLTSLLPSEGTWSLQEGKNNYYPYSLPIILKDQNYKAFAYHNSNYKFYNRDKTHPNLGYNYKGCGNGLETKINCNIWPQSDLEMFNETINDYINEKHFITYYMTVSMHLSYNNKTNDIANKNKKQVQNLPYKNKIKTYLSTAIELDKALENLINTLEQHNKLDDTVIVLSADHFPYGLSQKEINEKDPSIKDNFDLDKNTLIIWNNQIKQTINIDKYCSNIDVLPTLLNLFGIDYDSRLLIGTDILSQTEGLVIFNNKSFRNEYGTYNSLTDKFIKTKDITNEEIEQTKKEVYNKFAISRLILKEDYYKYLK